MEIELRSDEEISSGLIQAVLDDTRLIGADVSIEVRGNRITLRGSVPYYWQKLVLLELANQYRGILEMDGMLEVKPPRPVEDNLLADKADRILAEDAWFEAVGIKTEAFDGTLSLSGTVDSLGDRARAERALWGLPGLLDIRNELIVLPPVVKGDLAIAEEIRKELEEEGISLERIQLNVTDRVAVLTGTVPSLALKARIGQLARRSRGAREVINKLATFEALT